jgi:hypothetical protein
MMFRQFTKLKRPIMCLALLLGTTSCGEDKADGPTASSTIRPLHTITFENEGIDLHGHGDLLAVAVKSRGISVLDTSNPKRPLSIAQIELPLVYKTFLQQKSVYGFDSQRGLVALDLQSQGDLSLSQALSSSELYGQVTDALWLGDHFVFSSESIGLSEYHLQKDFRLVGGKADFTNPYSPGITHLFTLNDLLVTSSYYGALTAYHYQADQPPEMLQWIATPHRISDLACTKRYCYTAALAQGVYIYDPYADNSIQLVGHLSLDKTVELAHVSEDFLFTSYLGSQSEFGFYVFDLTGESTPEKIHQVSTNSPIKDFESVDSMLYVLLENGELNIYSTDTLN